MPHAALWRDDAIEHPTMLAYATQLVSNAACTQPCSVPLPLPVWQVGSCLVSQCICCTRTCYTGSVSVCWRALCTAAGM